ncbi:MAG: EAL domain-containing protein [Wenzhouxiangella sp.]|nr:MAG: EAL domain-containing protein [Wenzhouxiangella sp.]
MTGYMNPRPPDSSPLLRVSTLAWLSIILLTGAVAMGWKAWEIDRQMRADLLTEAEHLVETLNPQRLVALSGTEADANLPEYQRLKTQFQAVRQAFPSYRFIYLMVRREDQTVIIQLDSEPPGSEDESLPGEVYDEITPEDLQVFDPGIGVTVGPTEDRWGVWISALVPVPMPLDYPGQMALGIDIDARDWRRQIFVRAALPIALAMLALLFIAVIGQVLVARRARNERARLGVLRHLEPALVIAVGLVLTAVATWIVQGEMQRNQARAFDLLARTSTQSVGVALRNLRDFGVEGLGRFFEASTFVTEEEFDHYTELLTEKGLARHWAWAPKVPAAQREVFEQQIRAQGLPDFRIWEAENDGQSPGPDRDFHYPITLLTKQLPALSLPGLDLASLAHFRNRLESAHRTGLVTASAPVAGTYAPQLQGHMLLMRPTGSRLEAAAQEGVVLTTLAFDELLSTALSGGMLDVGLWLLHEDGSRQQLGPPGSTGSPDAGRLVLQQPILIFGEAFLIRAMPGLGFAPAHRSLAGAGTALAGTLLTMMLATVVGLVVRRRETLEQAVQDRTIALQKFRTAVEQSNEGIALTDLDGTIRFVNRAWAEMHGYRADQLTGGNISVFHAPRPMGNDGDSARDELMEVGFTVGEGTHLHRSGQRFPARMSSSLARNEQGEPFGIIEIARDISEEMQQREHEQFDQRFRALVADIAAGFISAADDVGLDQMLEEALSSLGHLFEADRAYLFRFSSDMATASNSHEWCATGISPQKQALQDISLSDKKWWMAQWCEKRPIRIESVAELPPEAASEQALLEARSIRSLIRLPMFDEQARLLGFMGFDLLRRERRWPDEQVSLLQVVADILAGALRRRDTVRALALSESRYRELAEESRSFRWQVDTDGLYTDVDPLVEEVLGYRPDELIGKKYFFDLAPEADRDEIRREGLKQIRAACRFSSYSNRIVSRDGRIFWVSSTILPLFDAEGRLIGVRGSDTDITERKQAELQLEHLAHHDLLTGLPNRVLLADRMQQAMAQADRRGELLGVACLDLDAFKPINDRFGHEAGDQLLVTVAQRMQLALREGDTVARLGGDEFALVLVGLPDVESCQPLLQRLLDAVAEPFEHQGHWLQISISLGISFYPQSDAIDADQLLRQADQAMYQAKLAGKNRYHLFDSDHDRRLRSNHQQIDRLRQGLEDNEFVLHYQPKVDMKQGRVVGMEALIRWQHPDEGLLPPAAFLPLLDQHKLMIGLGNWVIDSVLTQITSWRAAGLELPVSLNIDPLQLNQPDFIDNLASTIRRYPSVQAGDVELEVLETSALDDAVSMVEIIEAAGQLGVSFSLDDFGTGYSSLSYLKRLPVTTLKIDRSFVHDMLHDPDDLAILQGIISLAQTFRHAVIAEGVETEAHGEMLLQLGCRLGQGYAIARPMPAEEVPDWLNRWRPPPSWPGAEPIDTARLPLLVAMVEYRNWRDRLRRLAWNEQPGQIVTVHPASEFAAWLESNVSESQAMTDCLTLHCKAERLAAKVIELSDSGQSELAGEHFAKLDAMLDDLMTALRTEIGRPS